MQTNYYNEQLTEIIEIFLMLEEKLAVGLIKKWYSLACMFQWLGINL